jgi:hypothetical protein
VSSKETWSRIPPLRFALDVSSGYLTKRYDDGAAEGGGIGAAARRGSVSKVRGVKLGEPVYAQLHKIVLEE